jgi:hypothetical protein
MESARNQTAFRSSATPGRWLSSVRGCFSSEYRPLKIIEPASGPNWPTPWIIIGTLIVLGAALIFVFAR